MDRFVPPVMAIGEKIFNVLETLLRFIDEGFKIHVNVAEMILEWVKRIPGAEGMLTRAGINLEQMRDTLREMREDARGAGDDELWAQFSRMSTRQVNRLGMAPAPGPAMQMP